MKIRRVIQNLNISRSKNGQGGNSGDDFGLSGRRTKAGLLVWCRLLFIRWTVFTESLKWEYKCQQSGVDVEKMAIVPC